MGGYVGRNHWKWDGYGHRAGAAGAGKVCGRCCGRCSLLLASGRGGLSALSHVGSYWSTQGMVGPVTLHKGSWPREVLSSHDMSWGEAVSRTSTCPMWRGGWGK